MAYAMLKSNEYVPEEIEMLKEIASLKEALAATRDREERTSLSARLHDRQLALTIALEKHKRRT